MKRLHINIGVEDLGASVHFYSRLLGTEPTVLKDDYARFMLEDPRVNLALSTRSSRKGVDHLGVQTEDEAELEAVYDRLAAAGGAILDEGETTCCYAKSKKRWTTDPQGVAWEAFLTRGESAVYGHEREDRAPAEAVATACCG